MLRGAAPGALQGGAPFGFRFLPPLRGGSFQNSCKQECFPFRLPPRIRHVAEVHVRAMHFLTIK